MGKGREGVNPFPGLLGIEVLFGIYTLGGLKASADSFEQPLLPKVPFLFLPLALPVSLHLSPTTQPAHPHSYSSLGGAPPKLEKGVVSKELVFWLVVLCKTPKKLAPEN